MTDGPSLELPERSSGRGSSGDSPIPAPLSPDDPAAWYAPEVRAQYEVHPGVVATVRETDGGFSYDVREPILGPVESAALDRVLEYFDDASLRRPLTREGTVERVAAGFEGKYSRIIDRLTNLTTPARRRIEYHALCEIRCLGELTPLALDDEIEIADPIEGTLVVHTADFAPAETDVAAADAKVERFASERIERYTVEFQGFELPVVIYRENVLGNDSFTTKYAVLEPELLPGDERLIQECKDRIWETNVDGIVEDRSAFVRNRARRFLSRQLTARNTRAWLDAARFRCRTALAEYGLTVPPLDHRFSTDRLEDLVYYVQRDYVGHGKLTIPIRDPHLEDIEANRIDERIKVVPRPGIGNGRRIPTNLVFDDETEFINVVTQLAAADGTEVNASTPSAKVNLAPDGVPDDVTIRCALALPIISEDGPHISIRKQAPEAMTPVDLIKEDSISVDIVTLLWQLYENHGVALFSGPTGVGKTTIMNAHMPFIPHHDRPISIDEGSREVRLPHETGISLTTRNHESEYKCVTMADLMTECNYLNPDVEVIAEINTPESFRTFAETLNTGHGVLGTTHAENIEKLVNRVIEQGLPPYLLQEIDLVVFPKYVDGDRYVSRVVELVGESEFESVEDNCGAIQKEQGTIYWNTVARRDTDGTYHLAYDHPSLGDTDHGRDCRFFDRLADRTDRSVESVEREFRRKRRYVEYLTREGIRDFDELFEFLTNLEMDEGATIEREQYGGHDA